MSLFGKIKKAAKKTVKATTKAATKVTKSTVKAATTSVKGISLKGVVKAAVSGGPQGVVGYATSKVTSGIKKAAQEAVSGAKKEATRLTTNAIKQASGAKPAAKKPLTVIATKAKPAKKQVTQNSKQVVGGSKEVISNVDVEKKGVTTVAAVTPFGEGKKSGLIQQILEMLGLG